MKFKSMLIFSMLMLLSLLAWSNPPPVAEEDNYDPLETPMEVTQDQAVILVTSVTFKAAKSLTEEVPSVVDNIAYEANQFLPSHYVVPYRCSLPNYNNTTTTDNFKLIFLPLFKPNISNNQDK